MRSTIRLRESVDSKACDSILKSGHVLVRKGV